MKRTGTLADRAYQFAKHGILHGEFPEGEFLKESDILQRYSIGGRPSREGCNRLCTEQLLAVVPQRGYFVPELSFGAPVILVNRMPSNASNGKYVPGTNHNYQRKKEK